MEHAEYDQSSSRKNLTNSLEQKIRCLEKQRKELLEVNQQWDQQFRSMKELYERKVAELKTKLDAAERFLSAQEEERQQSQRASDRRLELTRERLQRQEVGGARRADLPRAAAGSSRTPHLCARAGGLCESPEAQSRAVLRNPNPGRAPLASSFVDQMGLRSCVGRAQIYRQRELI